MVIEPICLIIDSTGERARAHLVDNVDLLQIADRLDDNEQVALIVRLARDLAPEEIHALHGKLRDIDDIGYGNLLHALHEFDDVKEAASMITELPSDKRAQALLRVPEVRELVRAAHANDAVALRWALQPFHLQEEVSPDHGAS